MLNNQTQEFMYEIHQSYYEMLLEVDRVCKKYNINYFISDGTLLGAIRDKDFIPWDDDADITFLRDDYERFLIAYEKEQGERFVLLKYEDFSEFYDFTSKIADMSIKYKQTSYGADALYGFRYNHPTLDLFVYDIASPHFKWQLAKLKFIYSLAIGHRPYYDFSKFVGVKKIIAWILVHIGKIVPYKKIIELQRKVQTESGIAKIEKKNQSSEYKLFGSNYPPSPPIGWGKVFENKFFSDGYDRATIRDKEFPIPKFYDEYLRLIYGDYMKKPPEEERVQKHIAVIE